jgi:hypothetical protein
MQAKGFNYRLWNGDMAACRNFLHIIFSLRAGGEIFKRFCRNTAASKNVKETKLPNNEEHEHDKNNNLPAPVKVCTCQQSNIII